MKQLFIKKGNVTIEDVPAPLIEAGDVLVETAYSLISIGTEMAGMQQSSKSLLKQAIEKPKKVVKVVNHLRQYGIQKTVSLVQGQVGSGTPSGYSCAGVVIQVGSDITDLKPGQWVACAGAGKANHAELVLVPRNLVVKLPEGCSLRDAASATLGAIAMQGVRRADPRLGEIVAVIGLGLIGQITAQLLKIAGCRVIGLDLSPRRVELAQKLGLDVGLIPAELDVQAEIHNITAGYGVDSTIITASSQSNAIVQQAMEITRKKGRVVVVGAVGLGLERSPFYAKEIDFLISCSYGPGRYDKQYEEKGLDYPYGYVRWTENRNMAEYLRLIATKQLDITALLEKEYDINNASDAYKNLGGADGPLGVLLSYGLEKNQLEQKQKTKIILQPFKVTGKINVALIGAGGFAKAFHLPNLNKLSDMYHLRAVVSATGSNAKARAIQFQADYCTTNYEEVLADNTVDMVLICTRHHLHVKQAIAAAKAGKAIFMEKPMALNQTGLDELTAVLQEHPVPFMVGFNRRFSLPAKRAREILSERRSPLMMMYRVNAGWLPPDHWVNTDEGGGRIIGEACHMFDLFQYLVSPAKVAEVSSTAITPKVEHISATDNVTTTILYDDGSVATLFYTALGSAELNKEYLEIYADGKILVLDNYQSLQIHGAKAKGWKAVQMNKGQFEELRTFAHYVRGESKPPISLQELVETTKVSFAAAGKQGMS